MIIYTPITLWKRFLQCVKQTFRPRRTPSAEILAALPEVHYTNTEEEYRILAKQIGLGTKYKLNDIKTGNMEEWLPISAATSKVVIIRRNLSSSLSCCLH